MINMDSLINLDSIKIYVPERTLSALKKDAEHFEVLSKNQEKINFNSFLSLLLCGFYDQYQDETEKRTALIRRYVDQAVFQADKAEELTHQLMTLVFSESRRSESQEKDKTISLRPTKDTDHIIARMIQTLPATESLSSFFGRMFLAYLSKPSFERERIIYYKNADVLSEACRKKLAVSLALRSRPLRIHYVLPYELVCGLDEQYNYLLGQEFNEYQGRWEAVSYRLCRIVSPGHEKKTERMDENVLRHLEMMKRYGPQYIINEDTETIIRLSGSGRESYRKIYQGRPMPDLKGAPDSDDWSEFRFHCSQDQLYQYFRRFNPGEAHILQPETLKDRIRNFHQEHLEQMK